MIRLLTAAAMAALLASPVMAQSVSPSDQSGSSIQNQGTSNSPGSSPSESVAPEARIPGLSGQTPTDCLPNDARPECQTAQMPGEKSEPESSSPGVMMPPAERSESGSAAGKEGAPKGMEESEPGESRR